MFPPLLWSKCFVEFAPFIWPQSTNRIMISNLKNEEKGSIFPKDKCFVLRQYNSILSPCSKNKMHGCWNLVKQIIFFPRFKLTGVPMQCRSSEKKPKLSRSQVLTSALSEMNSTFYRSRQVWVQWAWLRLNWTKFRHCSHAVHSSMLRGSFPQTNSKQCVQFIPIVPSTN